MSRVGLVIVSHSTKLAEGVVELAGQMTGGAVPIEAAGGNDAGTLGTSAPRIVAAIERVLARAEGAVILLDLGSAAMNAALAIEMIGESQRPQVRIASAPLVEGAVLAAVSAAGNDDLDTVCREAESGRDMPKG